MKTHRSIPSQSVLCLSTSLLLFTSINSWAACGPGATTITVVPGLGGSFYRVSALNANGQVAGFSYTLGDLEGHAFRFDSSGITDLGTLGGTSSQEFGLNNSGQVVGESGLAGETAIHAFFYNGTTMADLGTLGGGYSTAVAINDAGQIAGHSELLDNPTLEAFISQSGSITSLGHLGGEYSTAMAINQAGDVAGSSLTTSGELHAFLYSNGTMIDLGSFGGGYSVAYALNDSGTVVGDSALLTGEPRGFVYSAGVMVNIGTLGGTTSSAYDINNAGQVIGTSTTTGDAQFVGFIYSGGLMTNLGTLGGSYSVPRAINDAGQVVGDAQTATFAMRAFLWQNGSMSDLNSLLPAGSGWELSSAYFINNAGRIVGQGTLNGQARWFILDLGSANNPPVANAGDDQVVDCGGQLTLNGTLSSDPNDDPLTYQWSYAGYVFSTNATVAATFDPGTNEVTLTVTDPCGESSQDIMIVKVTDLTAPAVSVSSPLTIPIGANCQAAVPMIIAEVMATDNCTSPGDLVVTQNPVAGTLLNSGSHTVIVTVTDASGNSTSTNVTLNIVDATAPVISTIAADPCAISPPNNSLVPVTVFVAASDDCDTAPVSQIISITADEPIPSGDIEITGLLTAKVRASKNASGNDRIYTITVRCQDASANSSTRTVTVKVLKNKNGK